MNNYDRATKMMADDLLSCFLYRKNKKTNRAFFSILLPQYL